jgi:hypothetical protein
MCCINVKMVPDRVMEEESRWLRSDPTSFQEEETNEGKQTAGACRSEETHERRNGGSLTMNWMRER